MWSNYPFQGVAEDALTFTFYHRKAKRNLLFFNGIKMTKSIKPFTILAKFVVCVLSLGQNVSVECY